MQCYINTWYGIDFISMFATGRWFIAIFPFRKVDILHVVHCKRVLYIAGFSFHLINFKMLNLTSIKQMLKHQMLQQLHTAFINGRTTTWPLRPCDKLERIGGILWPLYLFRAGWFLRMAMASFNLLLKSLSSFTSTFTSAKVYLWPVMDVCSVMPVGMFTVSVFFEPHTLCPSCFANVLLTPTTFHIVHHPTLFLFLGLIFGAYQQGPKSVKQFVVQGDYVGSHWSCSEKFLNCLNTNVVQVYIKP